MMNESFPRPENQQKTQEINGIPYDVGEDGRYTFNDINIGGDVDGEDFRDFIVNTERVGVRMDSTLVLPSGVILEQGKDREIFFTLPRTKQRGKIYQEGKTLWAVPV